MILLLERMKKASKLFFHGGVAFANHQSDLWRTQPTSEAQSQEFALQGTEPGQQRFQKVQVFLVDESAIYIPVARGRVKRDRQGIPGNNAFAAPVRVDYRVAGNLKKPGRERRPTRSIGGQRAQSLEKNLLGQVSRVLLALQASPNIVIHSREVRLV